MIGMKRTLRLLSLSLALAIAMLPLLGGCAWAKIPSPSRYFYVYDEPSVLSLTTEDHIVTQNEKLYAACGAQIVIACVNTTGDTDIADFADEMFNQWKIGSSQQNNGVLVLLSIEEDDYYAVQGRGLENLLSTGTLKLMLDEYLEPHFAAKDYDAGALAIFDALYAFVAEIYPDADAQIGGGVAVPPSGDGSGSEDSGFDWDFDDFSDWQLPSFLNGFSLSRLISRVFRLVGKAIRAVSKMSFLAFILLLIVVIRIISRRRNGGERSGRRGGCGWIIPLILGLIHFGGGNRSSGGGSRGPSGGGSHGSFGGGSHGGGGFTRGGGAGRR